MILAVLLTRSGYYFLGIFVAIVLLSLLRSSARNKQRSASFASLGFLDVPPKEAFEPGSTAACELFEFWSPRAQGIVGNVGKGGSALGETVIFDFNFELVSNNARFATVAGFRVPHALPDFHVHHTFLLDRYFHGPTSADPQPKPGDMQAGPLGMQMKVIRPAKVQIAFDDPPGFAKNYIVTATDEAAMRRVLPQAARDDLAARNDGKLHIEKGTEWLFVYRWQKRVPPDQYPAFLHDVEQLIGKLNLRAESAPA